MNHRALSSARSSELRLWISRVWNPDLLRGTVCLEALGPPHEAPDSLLPGWLSWATGQCEQARARPTRPRGTAPSGRAPEPAPPRPAPRRAPLTGRPGTRTPPLRAGTLGRASPVPPPRPAGARAGSRSRWQRRRRRGLFLLSLRPEEPREPGPCPRAGRRRRPLPSARVSAAPPPPAPIFRRSSVTRRRRRRRRGPEREAPGTGARRPPPPPWRRWDRVRSALGPGLAAAGGLVGG